MTHQVLVVDDSAMARTLIKRTLEVCGFENLEISEAADGLKALEALRHKNYDLVLTDLNMPECDGEQLLRRIKGSPRLNHIPVVIISSKTNTATEHKLVNEYASAVLSKPISLPALNTVLEQNLHIEKE